MKIYKLFLLTLAINSYAYTAIETRYGPIEIEYEDNKPFGLLTFNNKVLLNPELVGETDVAVDDVYKLNDIDIVTARLVSGNTQTEWYHYIIAIKPNGSTMVFGDDEMFAYEAEYSIENSTFIGSYDDNVLVEYDGQSFNLRKLNEKNDDTANMPDEVCQSLYTEREDLAQRIGGYDFAQYQISLLEVANRYSTFSEEKLKEFGLPTVDYETFKKNVCQ